MQYRMVQIPPDVQVAAKGMLGRAPSMNEVASTYLETIVNQMAGQGWEFLRVDAIGVQSNPGCLAALGGARQINQVFYVITFQRP